MGTDIHIVVQRKKEVGSETVWEDIASDIRYECYLCDGSGESKNTSKSCFACEGTGTRVCTEWYDGRNYTLFSFLADVRNDEGIVPIAPQRGLPHDFPQDHPTVQHTHSQSWLSVTDLLEAPWDAVVRKTGVVSPAVFHKWINGGDPYPHSASVHGAGIKMISNDQMREYVNSSEFRSSKDAKKSPFGVGASYYTRIEWTEQFSYSCGFFYERTLPALKEAANGGSTDDIRMVFGFDC